MPTWQPPQDSKAYEVDFVGRLSKPRKQYYGLYERLAVVDKLISIQEVPVPRPTKRLPVPEVGKN